MMQKIGITDCHFLQIPMIFERSSLRRPLVGSFLLLLIDWSYRVLEISNKSRAEKTG